MTTTRRRLTTILAALAVACAPLVLHAAGGSAAGAGTTTAASGRSLFVSNCGSCHTLKAAHTRSSAGPNLDRRFRRLRDPKIRRIVLRAVLRGDGAMPAGILTGRRARTVAAYVAKHTGRR